MNFLDFIRGGPYLATFFRLLGGNIGNDCCLYPTGGDTYTLSPTLAKWESLRFGCSSVVCHPAREAISTFT
jgi:hypothetical protein